MRQIKFRAWSKDAGCFCGAFSIHKSGMVSDMIDAKIDKDSGLALSDAHWGENDLIVTQYVGLKDREGTEIYEGDILSQYFCEFLPQHFGEELKVEQGNFIGEVIYAHDCYRINDAENEVLHKILSDCVVIGNRYENSELLQ